MILEYKKSKREIMRSIEINTSNYSRKKSFMFSIVMLITRIRIFFMKNNRQRKIELLEDSIRCLVDDRIENINFENIIRLEEVEEFIVIEIKGDEPSISIPIRVFKDINQKNKFKEIISCKSDFDLNKKEDYLEYNGVLEGNIDIENLSEEEINKRTYNYKMKKWIYKRLVRGTLESKEKQRYKCLRYYALGLVAIITIEMLYQFKVYELSFIMYLLLSVVIIGAMIAFRKYYFRKEYAIGKYVKENIEDEEVELKILKTQKGILYSINGKKNFILKIK